MSVTVLLTAVGVALLFEGIPLFMSPKHIKASAMTLLGLPDKTLRIIGLVIMLVGLGLMVVINT